MLRGNHESSAMTEHFTFRDEVIRKYDGDESVYNLFTIFALLSTTINYKLIVLGGRGLGMQTFSSVLAIF